MPRTSIGYTYVCRSCGADYSTLAGYALHRDAHPHAAHPWNWRTVYRVRHCGACDAVVYVRRLSAVTMYATARAAGTY